MYGRSVDDDTCISPTDASEFLYNRNHPKPGNLGTFLVKEDQNEDEDDPMEETKRRNSETFRMPPNIDEESQVKLLSCLDGVRNIVGETATDQHIVDTVMRFNYDMAAALDSILSATANAAATLSSGASSKAVTASEKGEY